MTAEPLGWHDEHLLDHRRRLRTAMFVSLAVHGLILALFAITPPRPVAPTPEYLAVDLVALAPPGGAGAPGAPAPSPPPPPAETAAPEPPPEAPPPAPVAKAPVQVLPEEAPGRIREAKPKPEDVVAKAKPKPTPSPAPRRRRREKALSYEAAMAELGLDETSEALVPAPAAESTATAGEGTESAPQAQTGQKVSPEQIAWDRAVSSSIKRRFPSLSRYEGRGLVAQVEVEVSASGALAREPRLVGTSGDLDFDRMIIAVMERAAPFPPPPKPGVRQLRLKSDR